MAKRVSRSRSASLNGRRWTLLALPASEVGISLLLEGGEAFSEVLAPGRQFEGEGLVAKVLVEWERGADVQQPLGQADGNRRCGGEPEDGCLYGRVEVGGGHA